MQIACTTIETRSKLGLYLKQITSNKFKKGDSLKRIPTIYEL